MILRRLLATAAVLCSTTVGVSAPALLATGGAATAAAKPSHVLQWWSDAMGLDGLHKSTTGKGVVVAVIDAYLNPGVPDLKGADIEQRANCYGRTSPTIADRRADHGTAMVTAIVGQGTGTGPGGRGVLGVAPDASVRFYSIDPNPKTELFECDTYDIGPLMVRAAREGADIISISLGDLSPSVKQYVDKVLAMGVVIVAPSGLKAPDNLIMDNPAGIPGVVAVNAATPAGKSWVSNPDPYPEGKQYPTITSPGVRAQLGGYVTRTTWESGAGRTGTSGATAIAAGAFAMLKSKYPAATGNQLIQAVIHTTGGMDLKMGEIAYKNRVGFGFLSLSSALDVDPTKYPDVNPLLKGPQAAIREFPASVYGATTSGGASASPSPSASAQPSNQAASKPRATTTEDTSQSGMPVWGWVVVAIVLVALALGGLLAARRRSRPDDHEAPVPVTASSQRHEGE